MEEKVLLWDVVKIGGFNIRTIDGQRISDVSP